MTKTKTTKAKTEKEAEQATPETEETASVPAPKAEEAPAADRPVPEGPVNHEEALEAILFAAGHPVTYEKLAQTFDISASQLREIARKYAKRYNGGSLPRGVMMILYDDSCQLCTKEQYISYIRFALGIRKSGTLSTSSIETLAIIAYHQPVTRAYVDAVRGVDSSYAVTNLLERELIEVRGRMDAPGRPMLYGTTKNFLRCFGLSSLAELPGIDNEDIEKVFSTVEQRMARELEEPDQLSIDEVAAAADGEATAETQGETAPDAATAEKSGEPEDAAATVDGENDFEQRNISDEDGAPVMRPAAPARSEGIIDLSAEEDESGDDEYDTEDDEPSEEEDTAEAEAIFPLSEEDNGEENQADADESTPDAGDDEDQDA